MALRPSSASFKGSDLYKRLQRHLMTERQLRDNSYPRPSEDGSDGVKFYTIKNDDSSDEGNKRICRRCKKRYLLTEGGLPVVKEDCFYHFANLNKRRGERDRYGCCNRLSGDSGCQRASCHVNEMNFKNDRSGFRKTRPAPESDPKNTKVLALDCEMVFTRAGLQLAQLTLIGDGCQVVYETLVKPDTDIIDYNTRFSGVKAKYMEGVVKTLPDVQDDILNLISDKTVLVGHGLESDLTVVKLIHSTIVDTSFVFPHPRGLPFKRALRNLAKDHLRKIIQNRDSGHDSTEDAVACMELILYKVEIEERVQFLRRQLFSKS